MRTLGSLSFSLASLATCYVNISRTNRNLQTKLKLCYEFINNVFYKTKRVFFIFILQWHKISLLTINCSLALTKLNTDGDIFTTGTARIYFRSQVVQNFQNKSRTKYCTVNSTINRGRRWKCLHNCLQFKGMIIDL